MAAAAARMRFKLTSAACLARLATVGAAARGEAREGPGDDWLGEAGWARAVPQLQRL
jgi:hypothetical protein